MNQIRLTDQLDIVGIDSLDAGDWDSEKTTTVNASLLQQAVDVVEALGWDTVDVCAVAPDGGGKPLLVVQPAGDGIMADNQAGVLVAPKDTDDTTLGGSDE